MAYFLVMGGLAVSLCFTLGWGLMRGGRWLVGRLSRPASRRRRTSSSAPRPAKPAAPARRRRSASRPAAKAKAPSGPSRLSLALAELRGSLPLGLVMLLLYGASRLVEHGMTRRPQAPPDGFHLLVEVLGWLAAALLALAALGLLAGWRCRR